MPSGPVFRHPRLHVPGRRYNWQTPDIADNRIFLDLSDLQSSTVATTTLPTTGALEGQIPVWDSNRQAYLPQSHVDIPFGLGILPAPSQQLTLRPKDAATYGLVIQGRTGQGKALREVRDASGAVLESLDPVGNLSLLGSLLVSGGVTVSGSLLVGGAGAFDASVTVSGSLSVGGVGSVALNLTVSGGITTSGSLLVGAGLQVYGATNLNGLTAGATTLNSAAVTGNLLVQGSSNLGGLTAGATTLNSLAVTGYTSINGLTAGASTLNSLTVSGLTTLNGGLALSGSTLLYSGASVTGTVVVTAPSLGRCLTLNSAAGATIFMVAASGTLRSQVRWGATYLLLTDTTNNGAGDFALQNLQTGNLVVQCSAVDLLTLGSTNSAGGVLVGVSGGKAGFYGTTPISQPAAATDLLTGLVNLGLRASGTDVPLSLGGGALVAGRTTLNSLNVTGSATFGSLVVPTLTLDSLVVSGVTNLGQLTAAASTMNSATVTGNLLVQGSTNLGGLTAGATTLNSLTVTGAMSVTSLLQALGGIQNSGSYGGNSTNPFQLKKFTKTFTSDSDYTLAAGEADCGMIDILTDAVLTTTRNIITPAGATGQLYFVINRNAFGIGLKPSGGAAIVIAAGHAAIVGSTGGTNMFRFSADCVYNV